MKKITILAVTFLLSSTFILAQTKGGRVDTAQHVSYYTCAMHPDIKMTQPGKCPKCGMMLSLSKKEEMKADAVKNYTCPMHMDVASHDPGKCPKCGKKLNLSPKEQMKAEVVKLYTCPMHPEVALNKDGVCPKCGKELVEEKNQ